jgi:hypothetical protein
MGVGMGAIAIARQSSRAIASLSRHRWCSAAFFSTWRCSFHRCWQKAKGRGGLGDDGDDDGEGDGGGGGGDDGDDGDDGGDDDVGVCGVVMDVVGVNCV